MANAGYGHVIADMLTRIRNAGSTKFTVDIPASVIKKLLQRFCCKKDI